MNLASPTEFAYFPGNFPVLIKTGVGCGALPPFSPFLPRWHPDHYGNQLAALGVEVCNEKKVLSENEVVLETEEQYWQIVSLQEKMKTIRVRGTDAGFTLQGSELCVESRVDKQEIIVLKVLLKQSEVKFHPA